MSNLRTPADLGAVIRQRRKAVGWDQAALAQEVGVSRQWIIEIEKGKPRAELQLVLRTLNVLGLQLFTSTPAALPADPMLRTAVPDIDQILESNRRSTLRYPRAAPPSVRPEMQIRESRQRPAFEDILKQAEEELAQRAVARDEVGALASDKPKRPLRTIAKKSPKA